MRLLSGHLMRHRSLLVGRNTTQSKSGSVWDNGGGSKCCSRRSEGVRLSRRVRLAIIVTVGLLLFGIPAMLSVVGTRQADHEATRVRSASTTAHVDTAKLLATMFDAQAPNPIAASLGVSNSDVSFKQVPSGWCAHVSIRRLVAQRDVFMAVSSDGTLRPIAGCPAS